MPISLTYADLFVTLTYMTLIFYVDFVGASSDCKSEAAANLN